MICAIQQHSVNKCTHVVCATAFARVQRKHKEENEQQVWNSLNLVQRLWSECHSPCCMVKGYVVCVLEQQKSKVPLLQLFDTAVVMLLSMLQGCSSGCQLLPSSCLHQPRNTNLTWLVKKAQAHTAGCDV